MRELCARVRAWCQVQATGAGRAWARRLLSMAATPLSCFRWRPRPFRSRQLPPAIVVELKLHRSTLLWRLRAAGFVVAGRAPRVTAFPPQPCRCGPSKANPQPSQTRQMHRAHPEHPFSVYSATERLKRFAPPCTKFCARGYLCQHKALDVVRAGFLRGAFHKDGWRFSSSGKRREFLLAGAPAPAFLPSHAHPVSYTHLTLPTTAYV